MYGGHRVKCPSFSRKEEKEKTEKEEKKETKRNDGIHGVICSSNRKKLCFLK